MNSKIILAGAFLATLAVPAFAADLPSAKGPPVYAPPPPPVFSWTGVYIGGQVGYDWSDDTSFFDPFLGPLNQLSPSGVIGGAHVGADYELGSLGGFLPGLGGSGGGIVIGVEGDVNAASTRDSSFVPGIGTTPGSGLSYSLRENEDFSIRGRLGLAFDRILIYGTGGGAYGNFHTSYTDGFFFDSFNTGHFGWTAGAGVEYAIDNNWSARIEYRYTDYGHFNNFPVTSDAGDPVTYHVRDNRVQAGFSYKFDLAPPPAPPVVAKY
jgi:outer membrane immunogenic protein